MPSGKVHAAVTTAAAGFTYLWVMKSGEPPDLAAAAAVGCAAGVFVNPDLDVIGTRADRMIREEGGLFIAAAWGLLWYPYSTLIPHRSIISHGLIIGTVIRILYIGLALLLLGIRIRPGPYFIRILAGLLISDNLHIGADFLVTGIKQLWHTKK